MNVDRARELRKDSTEAEKLLWKHLRDRQFQNIKFRRQHPFPPYILDFFCEDLLLAIELDGGQHNDEKQKKKDQKRTDFLTEKGIRIVRFWNNDVLTNIDGVLQKLTQTVPSPGQPAADHPLPVGEGSRKRILAGKIATAHGIKGFVKLDVYVENEDLINGRIFTAETGDAALTLSHKNRIGKQIVAAVDGIADRNAAEKLRGTQLYIDRDALPDPDDGEYYYEDLTGMAVIDENGAAIGTVLGVDNFGAGDLLDIRKGGSAESFYLLFIDDNILNVDMDERRITVRLPEDI